MKQVYNFYRNSNSACTAKFGKSNVVNQSTSYYTCSVQKTFAANIVNPGQITNVIIWALKSVINGYSDNFCKGFADALRAMCPDNKIASDLKLSSTKLMYAINNDITSHFKALLNKEIGNTPLYVLTFYESFNTATQESEIDILIRF